ncbi:E3 ubiquitin-protein ligase RNF180-like [Diorhabda carinulata]|uniref:E3 ubiquitin-protein ligase RNF180-like n=1 Tax=Diorhabda carinulata TaxID=1163345 RepID=UPI0025A15316|nr:E3 ubiquitin-protein ligase RNF180-like [Diorhabda carinulata]
MFQEIKCKKCRHTLFNQDTIKNNLILNAHGETTENSNACQVIPEEKNIFLNEDCLPSWVKNKIEVEEWSKGRIYCPKCDSRIGAFDYVSGQKCNCLNNLLPPVHIIKSKIDIVKI